MFEAIISNCSRRGETTWRAVVRMAGIRRPVFRTVELPSLSHAQLAALEWSQRHGKTVRWKYDGDTV